MTIARCAPSRASGRRSTEIAARSRSRCRGRIAQEGGHDGGSDEKPTAKPDRKPPKVISPPDPSSAWTAKANKRVQFGYGLNYLIDVEHAIVRNGDGGRDLATARWAMPLSQHAVMEATKKRAKLEAKGKPDDFKQLLRMELDATRPISAT